MDENQSGMAMEKETQHDPEGPSLVAYVLRMVLELKRI
jgi:hypothetical protein